MRPCALQSLANIFVGTLTGGTMPSCGKHVLLSRAHMSEVCVVQLVVRNTEFSTNPKAHFPQFLAFSLEEHEARSCLLFARLPPGVTQAK